MRAFNIGLFFCFSLFFFNSTEAGAWSKDEKNFDKINKLIANKEYQRAYPLLLDSARKGNGLSQFVLGLYYRNGWGIGIDVGKSCHWFKSAANKGIPAAQGFWADCMMTSRNIDHKSASAALAMYVKAAENGYFIAWCQAADFYIKGLWVNKDVKKGLDLCAMAAERSVPTAMHKYGNYLHEVEEPYKNLEKAKEWLYRASMSGIPEAKYELANLFAKGNAIDINLSDAINLMESAAYDGYVPAYYKTAVFYYNKRYYYGGIINSQDDFEKIYIWLSIAAKVDVTLSSNDDYIHLLNFIDGKVSVDRMVELNKIVNEHLVKFEYKIKE